MSRAVVLCAFMLAGAVFDSCGPSPVSTVLSTGREHAIAGQLRAPVRVQPAGAEENLLSNASLEEKDEAGRPRGWAVSPASIIVKPSGPEYDAFDGTASLTLRSVSESWGILAQDIRLDGGSGKSLFVAAQGRSPLKDFMRLSVVYRVDGVERETYASWPACPDSWTSEAVTIELPPRVDGSTVRVRVIIRNKPGYIFRVDDFRAVRMK